jgi:hypothetical protein
VIVKLSFRRDHEMPFDNLSSTSPRSKPSCHSMSRQEFHLVNTAYHQRLVEAEEDVRFLSNGRADYHLRKPSRNGCHPHPSTSSGLMPGPELLLQLEGLVRVLIAVPEVYGSVQTRFWSSLHIACMFDSFPGYPLHRQTSSSSFGRLNICYML